MEETPSREPGWGRRSPELLDLLLLELGDALAALLSRLLQPPALLKGGHALLGPQLLLLPHLTPDGIGVGRLQGRPASLLCLFLLNLLLLGPERGEKISEVIGSNRQPALAARGAA